MSLDALAALATIVGTLVSVFALVQSSAWLVAISVFFVCISIAAALFARRERMRLNSASTVIEGHSIDSLNIANLRRRVDRAFVIQEVHHMVRVTGEDFEIEWKYTGFCKKDGVSSIDFSIDSDDGTPFKNLGCVAFDLARDPGMNHQIQPVLIGTEGISKKVSVTFLEPLNANQPFSVLLKFILPRCVKPGFGYYTSSSSFSQKSVPRCVVHLIFVGTAPAWMRGLRKHR